MINLQLDEQEAFFLNLFLDEVDGLWVKEIFKTLNENDEHSFDEAYFESVKDIKKRLEALRYPHI